MKTPDLKFLKRDRPICCFDLEATGTDVEVARIVEMSLIRLEPDGTSDAWVRRFHPGISIPPATTKIHGITDADVRDCPKFAEKARSIATYFAGADICGFNCRRYDVPLLIAEMKRAGIPFEISGEIADVMEIFCAKLSHTLSSAAEVYLGQVHDAHSAEADVIATLQVLDAMLGRYPDLPNTIGELATHKLDPSFVDREGKLRWEGDDAVFSFGKVKGRSLREVVRHDPGYLHWALGQKFDPELVRILQDALRGIYPEHKEATDE